MPWAARQTLEGTREFVKSSRSQLAANEGIQAAIIDQHSIAGVIGFNRLDWENRSATLGY
jgi:ribosomal-protein-serine acetyltransferase